MSSKRAHENTQNGTAPLLAWRARNLLELSVWSNWCAKSRDNARCVYEDAGRDVGDIFDAFMKWGTETAQPTDWLDPIATAKQDLAKRALLLDIKSSGSAPGSWRENEKGSRRGTDQIAVKIQHKDLANGPGRDRGRKE